MKKLISIIMGGIITTATVAQNVAKSPVEPQEKSIQTLLNQPVAQNSNAFGTRSSRALGATLFTETFGNGISGDGTNGAWTTNGKDGVGTNDPDAIWEYRGTTTNPNNTVGSIGAYAGNNSSSNQGDPIASTTAANGFFIFDSDFLDNAGTRGAFGSGLSPTPHESWLISPSFSTTGAADVSINFNTYFRRFKGIAFVLLSIDGGTTWGDSVIIMDETLPINSGSTDDFSINQKVNFIANQANVKIAFYFDGITEGDGYYFVMVDDITISESPDNDLVFEQQFYRSNRDTGVASYYSMVPLSQAHLDTLQFSAQVFNNGSAIQLNTKFTNVVTTPIGSTTLTSNLVNLALVARDTLTITTTYVLNQGVGNYSWAMAVSSDSIDDLPANNAIDTVFVQVTDTTYARDFNATGNFGYGSGSTFEIGPLFTIHDTCKATSISIRVGDNSEDGEVFSVYLYNSSFVLIASKEFLIYDSTANVGQLMTIEIPEVLLIPGDYITTFKTYSDKIFFPMSPNNAADQTVFVDPSAGGVWFYTSIIPVVRLNVDSNLLICSVNATITQVADDSIMVTASNGTTPYSYLWSNGATTAQIGGLQNCTNYSVVVTDSNLCIATANFDLVLQGSTNTDVCSGSSFTYVDGTMINNITSDQSRTSTLVGGATGGCDSIITEHLFVIPLVNSQMNYNVCYGDDFTYADGTQVTNVISNINYVSTFSGGAANGCDSTVTEYLTTVGKNTSTTAICTGSSYTFVDGTVISNITSPTSHTSVIIGGAIGGCDSLVEENITVIMVDVSVTENSGSLLANIIGASYQWLDCVDNQSVTGAINRIFTPIQNGIYKVAVTKGSCSDTSVCYSVVVDEIQEATQNIGVTLYPNPVVNTLTIENGFQSQLTIVVVDFSGKKMNQIVSNQRKLMIDFSGYPSGVYLVYITNGTDSVVKNIVKK